MNAVRYEYCPVMVHPTARTPGQYGAWRPTWREAAVDRNRVDGAGIGVRVIDVVTGEVRHDSTRGES